MACVYCDSAGPFTDEHVLTRALAGAGEDWVLKDMVCAGCNRLFKTYERAWTSEPAVAMARIYYGPAGRPRKGRAYQVHPSEDVFLIADFDPVAYEVDILRGIVPRLRAQLIATKDRLFPTASDRSDLHRLNDATNAFWKERAITIQKRLTPGPKQFRVAVLSLDETFAFEQIEWRAIPPPVWLDRFPLQYNLSPDPRMSVDAFGRLRFRVRKLRHIVELLNRALREKEVKSPPSGKFEAGKYQVRVLSIYDTPKVHRAVAKTVVNYAVDQFGPEWIASPGFRPIINYCLHREDARPDHPYVGIETRPTGIATIDKMPQQRHGLALWSDGKLLVGLVKLYGGVPYKVHMGPIPSGTGNFIRSVQIDYNGKGRL